MKIKDHPQWQHWSATATYKGFIKTPSRDYGEYLLKEVKYIPENEDRGESARVGLKAELQGQEISAVLPFDDSAKAEKLCKELNADGVGKAIREIGEMEIPA